MADLGYPSLAAAMTIERVSVVAPARKPDAARTVARPPSAIERLYPALGNPNFRVLWLGSMPATLAVMMNQVASPYAAFTLSNSAAILGIVSLAQGLPMLCLSLVGGVAADRLPRRFVLIGSQTTLGLAAAALAVLGMTGNLQVWHVVASSFVQGAAFAFNMPARQAYIAELVARPYLANAAALNNAGQNFCRVAGPALAGMLMAIPAIGIGGAFLSMAGMYVLALAALFRLPGARPPGAGAGARSAVGSAAHLVEGLRYVRSNPPIMALIAMNLIVVVFGQPYQTLMPVVSERVFSAGAEGLGWLMAASGAGALTGAIIVASLSRLRRPATVQVGLAIALGLSMIIFSMTRSFPVALALLVVVGFLFSAFSALNNTLLMANTEPRLTGRVMSIYLLTWGAMPVGSLPLAWLAERAGAPLALMVSGVLVTALVVALAVLYPHGRRLGWGPRGSD
jgi:MFS family permease